MLTTKIIKTGMYTCLSDPINDCVHLLVNRFEENVLLIVQYKYLNLAPRILFSRI